MSSPSTKAEPPVKSHRTQHLASELEKSSKGVSSNLHAVGEVEATGSYVHVSLVTVAKFAISACGWTRGADDANVFRVSSVILKPSSLACGDADTHRLDQQLEKPAYLHSRVRAKTAVRRTSSRRIIQAFGAMECTHRSKINECTVKTTS